jgi:two-component system chemotaxis response regulator CheY
MRILIADDERELADVLTTYIQEHHHEVVATVTTGGLDVIYAYNQFHPDLVIMDIMMPKFNGLTVCHALLSRNPEARVVLVSGRLNPDHPFLANTGAIGFLSKPANFSKLEEILNTVEASIAKAA